MNDPIKRDSSNLTPGNGSSSTVATGGTSSLHAPYSGRPDDLHDLFAVNPNYDGPIEEDPLAALRNDPNYSALIRDLEYIAKQARMLFEPAAEEPSDDVWNKIQSQLKSEIPDA